MQENYVKLNGKERIDKIKYSLEQVSAPNFTDDYGRLIKLGYVVFDFDEQPYINIISNIVNNLHLKCKKLTTTRGCHFMFKTTESHIKCKSHEFNWLGLQCDIKGVGTEETRKTVYQAIKVNGIIRKEEYLNGATNDEELDYAPIWLYHIPRKKDQVNLTNDLTGSRNDMFHRRTYDTSKKIWSNL